MHLVPLSPSPPKKSSHAQYSAFIFRRAFDLAPNPKRPHASQLALRQCPAYTTRMLAKVYSCAVVGLDGAIVEVEVDTTNGLPSFVVVGSDSQYRSPIYGRASTET
jgi:hypothetical protein